MTIVNAFTIDLEDWFQGLTSTNSRPSTWGRLEARVERNSLRLLDLLDEYRVRATFFVLGHVAKQYPDLVRQIDAAGHEIGVHGYWHRMIHRLNPESFSRELDHALSVLSPLVSRPILGHRAPYFSINGESLWALDVLRDRVFCYDSSFFPTRNMLYGFPESPRFPHKIESKDLVEFPISTARWGGVNFPFAGGFYLRTLPYVFIRQSVRQLHRQGQPAVIYLHPWELDTGQRYNQVTPRERITHYHGRPSLEGKLRQLFSDFSFKPLRDLLQAFA